MNKVFNPDFLKAVEDQVNNSPYYQLSSMEIKDLAPGECTLELGVQEKHLQPYGMVHGGVYAALVDSACYRAVFTQIEEGAKMITVEMKLNYLSSASSGRRTAKGKSIKVGKTLCMGETQIIDGTSRLLAHGTATMMVMGDLEVPGDFRLPPRFLD